MTYGDQIKAFERRRAKILRLYAAGMSQSAIARKFKISRNRVWQIIHHE